MSSRGKVPDPGFGTAKVGDTLTFPNFLKMGTVVGTLFMIDPNVPSHSYQLYLFGVWIGTVTAVKTKGGSTWMAIDCKGENRNA